MVQPVYATQAELETFTGETVANADSLLRQASRLVDGLLIGAVYATDTNQKPTDDAVAEALNDATVLQAAYWHANGTPTEGATVYGNVSIGSVNLSRGQTPPTLTKDGQVVAPGVVNVLHVAGLVPISPFVVG